MKLETWIWIALIYVTVNIATIGLYFHKPIPVDWIVIFILLDIAAFKTINDHSQEEINERARQKSSNSEGLLNGSLAPVKHIKLKGDKK
jgi:hypothetical protein